MVMPNIVSYQSFFGELAGHLHREGWEVHVATCLRDKELLPAPREVGAVAPVFHEVAFARGMNPLGHRRAAQRLRRLVKGLEPDLVHAHFDAAIFTTALACRGGWPPIIATFHGMSFPMLRGMRRRLVRAATAWAAKQYDLVYVLHEENRRLLQEAAPEAEIQVWAGYGVGCDLERFAPVSFWEREMLRAELGFGPSQRVFAFVGRFIEEKGYARTVRAFLQLAQEDPDVRLLLVGCPDPLHGSGLSVQEEKALEGSGRVKRAGNRNDVERCLGAVDVLVLPSGREGMPVCLMEALAMGVPVIASDVCGCREVVRHKIDGLLVPNENPERLLEAMRALAGDFGKRRRFSAAALADRARFGREHFVREQMRIYRVLLQTAVNDGKSVRGEGESRWE